MTVRGRSTQDPTRLTRTLPTKDELIHRSRAAHTEGDIIDEDPCCSGAARRGFPCFSSPLSSGQRRRG
jgi:hypothetical protein